MYSYSTVYVISRKYPRWVRAEVVSHCLPQFFFGLEYLIYMQLLHVTAEVISDLTVFSL